MNLPGERSRMDFIDGLKLRGWRRIRTEGPGVLRRDAGIE